MFSAACNVHAKWPPCSTTGMCGCPARAVHCRDVPKLLMPPKTGKHVLETNSGISACESGSSAALKPMHIWLLAAPLPKVNFSSSATSVRWNRAASNWCILGPHTVC
eukprot:1858059-Amphidinium_carterae.1